MSEVPKQVYTAEFKLAAVQRVEDGQGVSVVARELGISEQTLRNWVKAEAAGKLNGAGAKAVTPEQMELSRLRAENKRLQMELEIAKKRRHTSRRTCCEVCVDRPAGRAVSAVVAVLRGVGQRERLSRVEAWRYAGANATDGHAVADADASWKDRRGLAAAIRPIYTAASAEAAQAELDAFADGEWGRRFPTVSASWRSVWDRVIPFFAFPPAIRKIIYTTNSIENINGQLHKIIKTRGHVPSDEAATNLIWLTLRNTTADWGRAAHDWKAAMNQFAIL